MERVYATVKLPMAVFEVTEIMCNDMGAEVPLIKVQQNLRMGLWDIWLFLFCGVDLNMEQYAWKL